MVFTLRYSTDTRLARFTQIMALEAAQINKDTLNILNVGAKAHKDALGKMYVCRAVYC